MSEELPDFLKLSDEDREREHSRQDKLRREFFSRTQMSGPRLEAARAMVIEKDVEGDRLADALGSQGRFIEAAEHAIDPALKAFYAKAADAVYTNAECDCPSQLATVSGRQILLPKYRVIKPAYSLIIGEFGYIIECNTCGNWKFTLDDLTSEIDPRDFTLTMPNDLQRLRA